MIKNIRVDKIEQLEELIWDQERNVKIERNRSKCLYRGLPKEGFHLVTSLKRNCKEKKVTVQGLAGLKKTDGVNW